ncbi:hypothetical protein DFR27_2308 [Umboniibacter marinipuniceus]|uniref:Uncharacterized protein n=1 Tax=Umboniibacter marinipuniceus TaxID=569599 RepID=A0A3M0A2V4_9GAMM|nr:hypothetical protein DFR27_2308 [Umboniibacter marinipuniceus]
MNSLKLGLAIILIFLLSGCDSKENKTIEFEDATVLFQHESKLFWISGNISVEFMDEYIRVENSTTDTVHYIPHERITYIGEAIEIR